MLDGEDNGKELHGSRKEEIQCATIVIINISVPTRGECVRRCFKCDFVETLEPCQQTLPVYVYAGQMNVTVTFAELL